MFFEQYLAHLTHRFAAVKRLLELRSIRSARDRLLHYLFVQRQPGTLTQLEAENVLSRKKGSITFNEEWLNS